MLKLLKINNIRDALTRSYSNTFFQSVATVASGTAGAQIVTIAFSPIITRFYGPEAFGLLGVFASIVAILAPIAALTYPGAIVLPGKDRDAKGLAWLSFWIALTVSALFAAALMLWKDKLLHLTRAEEISAYAMLIPLSMLFAAVLQITHQWMIRKKYFRITAQVAVGQAVIVNGAKAVFGIFNPVAAVLIIITTVGSLLQALMLWLGLMRAKEKDFNEHNTRPVAAIRKYRQLAREYYDFPAYKAPQAFLNLVSLNLPVLMLAGYYGPAAAGFFAIANKLLSIPAQLIGDSVGTVFYPHLAEAARAGEDLTRLLTKSVCVLAVTGAIPFGTVIALGPWLFGVVFGNEWVTAGEYARWLCLSLYTMFFTVTASKILPVIKGQGFALIFTIVKVGGRVITLLFGFILFEDDIVAVILYSAFGALLNLYFLYRTFIMVRSFQLAQMQREEKAV
jgi:O-antigen/teichoic acid export membrane protein